jgi:hypothetical protein
LIVAHLPGSRIDEALTASTGDFCARFGCQTVTVEQPFRRAFSARMGCPTAEAFCKRNGPPGYPRFH